MWKTCWYSRCSGHQAAANLPPATFRATSKQLWPSDLEAMCEIWIIPQWGRGEKKGWGYGDGVTVSRDFMLCVGSTSWLSGLETDLIAYGTVEKPDTISKSDMWPFGF